ncbi:hypothetical protein MKW94_014678 [Papaver nudicaule]|uniref:Pentatricopeptide repeat-containing protein n=1 Tax=Papaver nudicaule TaxID=74823 RepID=A0AA41RS43_PAPNU|nr:hypothetical protein [Papaver nudicaule]
MQIHAKIIKCGRLIDTAARNATITSYAECVFLKIHERSFAVELFIEMQRHGIVQDMYSYSSVLSACYGLKHRREGKSLHALAIKRGLDQAVPVCNSLITMYLKSSNTSMEDAIKIFDSMELKDNVSWNSILTGFSQNGLSEDALKFFGWMRSRPLSVDQYAFSAVIGSCSDLATFQLDDFVSSSLIFMYSKCGVVEDARKSFKATPRCSTITWNSIIFGYAQHGQGKIALDLFLEMNENNVKPDHITFVAVLTACSHIGLVEKGLSYLKSMESNYGIRPRMERFACGVDLLGRAGHVREAEKIIESLPFEADTTVLKTLLGACRLHGDIELATEIAKQLLILEPDEHCTYVLLSSMYGHSGSWEKKASIEWLMKERMVKKVPGWSWIEVKNEVHSFNAEDRSHPQHEEVYQRVEELMEEIKWLYHYEDYEFSYT